MQNFDIRSKYKPAVILRDAKKVNLTYDAIISLFEKSNYQKGIMIIKALGKLCSKSDAEAITLNLTDKDLLKLESGKFGFEHYEFSKPNISGMKEDMKLQMEAAELLAIVGTPIAKTITLTDCKVVATLPNKDSNFKIQGTVDLIYPHIQRILSEARQNIFIVNPFFDDDGATKILPTLLAAAKSGVSIKLIVREAKESAKMHSSLVRLKESFSKEGLENKLQIREYYKLQNKGQVYATHAKVILMDSKECYLGSANITIPSMYYNFELGCILTGEHLVKIKQLLDVLWECSSKV